MLSGGAELDGGGVWQARVYRQGKYQIVTSESTPPFRLLHVGARVEIVKAHDKVYTETKTYIWSRARPSSNYKR